MSHTLRKMNLGNSALVEIVIVDYAVGGEQFTLAELGLTGSLTSLIILGVDSINNPSNLTVEYAGGGKIKVVFRATVEIPATTGVNLLFVAFVHAQ